MSNGSRCTPARIDFFWPSRRTTRSSIAIARARSCRVSVRGKSVMLKRKSRFAVRCSQFVWGPARRDKRRPSRLWMVVVLCLSLVGAGACRQDMHNQPKYRGLRASEFFADGSSARPLVEGTIARGTLQDDEAFLAGQVDKRPAKHRPFPFAQAVLNRGRDGFTVSRSRSTPP